MDYKRKVTVRFIIILMILLFGICIALGAMGIISRGENSVLNDLKHIVKQIDNEAFTIVTETKFVQNGYFKSI